MQLTVDKHTRHLALVLKSCLQSRDDLGGELRHPAQADPSQLAAGLGRSTRDGLHLLAAQRLPGAAMKSDLKTCPKSLLRGDSMPRAACCKSCPPVRS